MGVREVNLSAVRSVFFVIIIISFMNSTLPNCRTATPDEMAALIAGSNIPNRYATVEEVRADWIKRRAADYDKLTASEKVHLLQIMKDDIKADLDRMVA